MSPELLGCSEARLKVVAPSAHCGAHLPYTMPKALSVWHRCRRNVHTLATIAVQSVLAQVTSEHWSLLAWHVAFATSAWRQQLQSLQRRRDSQIMVSTNDCKTSCLAIQYQTQPAAPCCNPYQQNPPTPILSPSHLHQFLLFHKPAATAPHALHCKKRQSLGHVCRQASKSRTECRLGHRHAPSVAGLTAPTAKRRALPSHPGSQLEELQGGRGYRPYPCPPEEPAKAPNPQQLLGMLHSQPAMHLSSSSTSAADLRRRQSLSGACLQMRQFPMIQLHTGVFLMIILQSQGQGPLSIISRASSSLQVRSSRPGCPRGLSKGSAKAAWGHQATRCTGHLQYHSLSKPQSVELQCLWVLHRHSSSLPQARADRHQQASLPTPHHVLF